jgi:rare lipoprotein A
MNRTALLAALALALAAALAGCSSTPPAKPAATAAKSGGYYLDDGPHTNPPADLAAVPDAVPREEPLHRYANRTYVALGNRYTPQTSRRAFRQEGVASWYGRRFHGKKTASGERYDMYAMTAAHPTLPIPSYARVTALNNGKSVVVRINDRGPFHSKRVIDLSYAAAHKLGYIAQGSTKVRVEAVDPDEYAKGQTASGTGAGGQAVYLQLGAFSNVDNAEQLLERLGRALALDADRARVVRAGGMHRVHIGPYDDDAAAQSDRARLRERLDLNAVLVRRD